MARPGDHQGKQQPGGHGVPGRPGGAIAPDDQPVAITAATSMPMSTTTPVAMLGGAAVSAQGACARHSDGVSAPLLPPCPDQDRRSNVPGPSGMRPTRDAAWMMCADRCLMPAPACDDGDAVPELVMSLPARLAGPELSSDLRGPGAGFGVGLGDRDSGRDCAAPWGCPPAAATVTAAPSAMSACSRLIRRLTSQRPSGRCSATAIHAPAGLKVRREAAAIAGWPDPDTSVARCWAVETATTHGVRSRQAPRPRLRTRFGKVAAYRTLVGAVQSAILGAVLTVTGVLKLVTMPGDARLLD